MPFVHASYGFERLTATIIRSSDSAISSAYFPDPSGTDEPACRASAPTVMNTFILHGCVMGERVAVTQPRWSGGFS